MLFVRATAIKRETAEIRRPAFSSRGRSSRLQSERLGEGLSHQARSPGISFGGKHIFRGARFLFSSHVLKHFVL